MGFKFGIPKTFTQLDVRHADADENSFHRWANKDCMPVPKEERKYTTWTYTGWWVAAGFNATAYSLGSSNIANGLTAGQAIGGVLIGSVLAGLVAVLCGEPGVLYHVGFPMQSRSTFGMYGSYFVVMLKCFVNFIFCGIQAYWGGLAVRVFLGATFPTFEHMKNTLPESAAIETNELIGFIIYIVVFIPLLFIHPSKLQGFLVFAFVVTAFTITGLFAWAVGTNHGAPNLIVSTKVLTTNETAFKMLQCISSVAGSWTGTSIRQSDWTRYSKTKRAPVWNQLLGSPITITLATIFGVFTTSAIKDYYGVTVWQPIQLLEWVLKSHYTPAARAGCFFAGLGFFISQLSVNVVQNSVAAGMDLASLCPKYIDVTRGSLIMIVIAVVINPWRFVTSPGTFITVLSSFGLFISPLAGINCVDFWLVRRMRWNIPHLYIGDSSSIYWYSAGMNWRAFLAWAVAALFSMPGFISAVGGPKATLGWTRVFNVTWFVGFLGGGLIYFLVCQVSMPPGKPYEKVFLEIMVDSYGTGTSEDVIEGTDAGWGKQSHRQRGLSVKDGAKFGDKEI